MNATLSELKLDQDQSPDDPLEDLVPPPSLPTPHQPQLSDASALWEAIERLDNMVVNNTVKVRSTKTHITHHPVYNYCPVKGSVHSFKQQSGARMDTDTGCATCSHSSNKSMSLGEKIHTSVQICSKKVF